MAKCEIRSCQKQSTGNYNPGCFCFTHFEAFETSGEGLRYHSILVDPGASFLRLGVALADFVGRVEKEELNAVLA